MGVECHAPIVGIRQNTRMIARFQQTIVFLLMAGLAAWTGYVWPDSSRIYRGFLALAGVYIAYLALLFIAIHRLNRTDPQPRASLGALAAAWLREVFTAPRVFLWRQPFRTFAETDHLVASSQRGVVFIHGFVCNRAFWSPWLAQLRTQNRAFASVTLEPAFGSIDDYPALIEAAVAKVTEATGQAPVLICHSMGGLAARAWLCAQADNEARIHCVITIGTPHFGTLLSKATLFQNTQQMQRFSAWLGQLSRAEPPARYAKFTCWYSNCDNIVVPTSTALLPGADNRLVTAQGHVSMAFSPRVMRESLALLD
jgi:predicted alpha/beta hydrolase family esterase